MPSDPTSSQSATSTPIRPQPRSLETQSSASESSIVKNPVLAMEFLDVLALFIYIVTAVHMKTKYEETLTD